MDTQEKIDTKNRDPSPYLPDGSPKWHKCLICKAKFSCCGEYVTAEYWPCFCWRLLRDVDGDNYIFYVCTEECAKQWHEKDYIFDIYRPRKRVKF